MTQQAIKTIEGGTAVVVDDAPIPELKDTFVLAETRALALNPTDYAHMRKLAEPGSTLGCDWAGVVLEVGKNETAFKPGDEVFGVCHGGCNYNYDSGCFAQKILCKDYTTFHKPRGMSFEDASTLGVPLITVAQTFYTLGITTVPSVDNLNRPDAQDILIYGGSSGTGTLFIQFAKLCGFNVLTTASPSNFPVLKDRGADHVFDYHDPESIAAIKSLTKDNLHYVIDCVGKQSTMEYCAQVISPQGGKYHTIAWPLLPKLKELRPESTVTATTALAYALLGETYWFKDMPKFEPVPAEIEFTKKWNAVAAELLETGRIRPHPANVRQGGLNDVLDGIKEKGKGGPSGKKIVYTVTW